MKALIENGVKAGFISAANAKLVEIVDIGDEAANDDESRAAEWGPLAVKTIQEWTFPVSTAIAVSGSFTDDRPALAMASNGRTRRRRAIKTNLETMHLTLIDCTYCVRIRAYSLDIGGSILILDWTLHFAFDDAIKSHQVAHCTLGRAPCTTSKSSRSLRTR